jgi:hypothetical protein
MNWYKIISVFYFWIVFSNICLSQNSFIKNIHSGEGYAIKECNDYGYAIAGKEDAYAILLKTDESGNIIFSKHFGMATGMSPGNQGNDLQVLPDGGFIIAGKWKPFANETRAYIIRTDSLGSVQWETKIPSPIDSFLDEHYAQKIRVTNSDEFISAGNISLNSGGKDISLMKLRNSGTVVWTKSFDLGAEETCYDLQITDSFYLVTGRQGPQGGGWSKYFILKTDTSGNIISYRIFGNNTDSSRPTSLYLLSDTSYILAGVSSFPAAQSFFWNRINQNLDSVSINYITNTTYTFGCGNLLRNDANIFTVSGGEIISPGSITHALIIQTDSNGNEIGRKYLIDSAYQVIDGACLNHDGSMTFTGMISGTFPSSGVYLVRIDSSDINAVSENKNASDHIEIINNKNILSVNYPQNKNTPDKYFIYSSGGYLKKSGFFMNDHFDIDCSYFSDGIYIIGILSKDYTSLLSEKFIINN